MTICTLLFYSVYRWLRTKYEKYCVSLTPDSDFIGACVTGALHRVQQIYGLSSWSPSKTVITKGLVCAAQHGHQEILTWVLDQQQKEDEGGYEDDDEKQDLVPYAIQACKNYHTETVRMFLERGVDPERLLIHASSVNMRRMIQDFRDNRSSHILSSY